MDDRISGFAFFATLITPVLGLLLLYFRYAKNSNSRISWLGKGTDAVIIGLSSLSFLLYYWYELSIPAEYNIRVDLFILYPILFVAFLNILVVFISASEKIKE